MADDEPLFISKDGVIWACWLNGKPAINLGSEQNFWAAAEKLFDELHPSQKPEPDSAICAASTSGNLDEPPVPPDRHIERSETRYEVTITGRLYGSDGSREVVVFDLSRHGCRVEDRSLIKVGSMVTIRIGTIGPIGAVVRWRRNEFAGLMFENPLHPAVLENIRQP